MALGLSSGSGGGDFLPILKYDARAGRFFRIDRNFIAGEWQKSEVEITQNFAAIFDLANVEVGYIMFSDSGAPDFRMVAIGQPLPQKPGDAYRQGFRVKVQLSRSCAQGDDPDVREFASTAGVVIGGLDDLHNAYQAAPEAAQGKLPVVKMTATQPVTAGQGAKKSTNYRPVLEIVGWKDRPACLSAGDQRPTASAAPPVQQRQTPPSTGSGHVAPPAAQQQTPAAALDDFG